MQREEDEEKEVSRAEPRTMEVMMRKEEVGFDLIKAKHTSFSLYTKSSLQYS